MHWDGPPLEAWAPWRPEEVAVRLAGTPAHWYVVGGFAIDLFLGRETRPHEDLEICVPRAELALVRERLASFVFHSVGDGEVRRLPATPRRRSGTRPGCSTPSRTRGAST